MAWMWLLAANSTANATSTAISAAPSGADWLASAQHSLASAAAGNGRRWRSSSPACHLRSVCVAINWHPRAFLAVAVIPNLAYWVLGPGLGGIRTGSGTDPDAGPLFILFAAGLYSLLPALEPAARLAPRPAYGG
jgi:hypothetical protein